MVKIGMHQPNEFAITRMPSVGKMAVPHFTCVASLEAVNEGDEDSSSRWAMRIRLPISASCVRVCGCACEGVRVWGVLGV